jgi:hypothetical protein
MQYPSYDVVPLAAAYLRSNYFYLASVSTMGYGDIQCTNIPETVVQLFVCYLSSIYFGVMVGSATVNVLSKDEVGFCFFPFVL